MSALPQESMTIPVTPELRRQFEAGAEKLNLSPAAYFEYLVLRGQPGLDSGRFDRHVREVFGKHGDLMRRLAR